MHRLPRRALSSLLGYSGALHRDSTAAVFSSSDVLHQAVGEIDGKLRLYSVFTADDCNRPTFSKPCNSGRETYLGIRYKSTASASDSSSSPSERYDHQRSFTHPSGLVRRGLHVEPGSREKALLAEDPALKRFKSHKKGVSRLKKVGDALTILVVAGCCYEIYVKAVMRDEARKQARRSA